MECCIHHIATEYCLTKDLMK